jgi:hypothetical protein
VVIGEGLAMAATGNARPTQMLQPGVESVDVKKMSRLPMMLAYGLALEHGITATSTRERLDALEKANVLSKADADILRDAASVMGGVRVASHLAAGWADDSVSLDPAKPRNGYAAPELLAVAQRLAPFETRIDAYLANPSNPF